jgi:hypothetical protein
MTSRQEDIRFLRGAAVTLALCLALGAGAVALAYVYWQGALRDHNIAKNVQQETKRKLSQARNEEIELKEKIGRYLALKQRGIVGTEKRLDWVEQISAIRRERKLPDLSYELSAQHPADRNLLPAGASAGGHGYVTSTLQFTTSILHEGDLTGILDDLQNQLAARISVRECRLERRADQDRTQGFAYGLRTDCQVELVTVKEPAS